MTSRQPAREHGGDEGRPGADPRRGPTRPTDGHEEYLGVPVTAEEVYLPGAGLEEPVRVDVEDVDPRLVDPALVADLVAPRRTVGTEEGEPLLRLQDVSVTFGGLVAVDSVTFDIRRGEVLALIGPNGAGKTTCFNVITGINPPSAGQVLLDGRPIGRARPHAITRWGIARTFQNVRLFNEMTALENVMVGTDARHRTSVMGALVRGRRHREEERRGLDRGMALLEFTGIGHRAMDKARNLPYGEQRRLEIARALATEPKILCLDEPAAGFNPAEKASLMSLIRTIRDDGYTILLIEHDMKVVRGVADRIVVLEFGRVIAEGPPDAVVADPAVIAAYLGVPDDAIA